MPRIEESPGEPQIIHGLFPITPFATVQVEVAILQKGGLGQELRRMRNENEVVLGYIGSISKQKSSSYILGAVLCYAVLRAEAYTREEVEHMLEETITMFFAGERRYELSGRHTREELMQIRELVERSYRQKINNNG